MGGVSRPLAGRVAVVAGATRGAGRGIARMLGEAGATVYCTGRSTREHPASAARPETIEETAELVDGAGGVGRWMRVDHTDETDVVALFRRVREEAGRLDVLVNDVWGGDALVEWGKPFWELDAQAARRLLDQAVWSHVLTSRHGVPLLLARGPSERLPGLVVEVTDGDFAGYRGQFYYDLVKSTVIRLAYAMAAELRGRGVVALAVTPGFLRSEAMLDRFGVTEATWREAGATDRHFLESETPAFVGRAVAALAADPHVRRKAGGVWASWSLAREYGFTDVDGRRPDFGAYFDRVVAEIVERGVRSEDDRFLLTVRYFQLHLDPARAGETARVAARLAEAGTAVALDAGAP
jgi:NAD(P)-dependent dehydrogenase (short-subunit alcohol dehydrogenase family)